MQQPSAQITIFSQPRPVKFSLFLRTHNFSHKSIQKYEKPSQIFFAKCETPNCSKISTSSAPFSPFPNPYQNYLKTNIFRANFQQRTNFSSTPPNPPPFCFNQKIVSKSSENTQSSRFRRIKNTSSVFNRFQPVTNITNYLYIHIKTVSNSTPLRTKKEPVFNRLLNIKVLP